MCFSVVVAGNFTSEDTSEDLPSLVVLTPLDAYTLNCVLATFDYVEAVRALPSGQKRGRHTWLRESLGLSKTYIPDRAKHD